MNLQVPAGIGIRVPLEFPSPVADRLQISLLEILDGNPIRDHFDKITIVEGQLVIHGLPPGEFQLEQPRRTTAISVSSGIEKDGLIVSKFRILPLHLPVNHTVAAPSIENDELKIQLRNSGPNTRISIVGKRFDSWPWENSWNVKPFSPPVPNALSPGFIGC